MAGLWLWAVLGLVAVQSRRGAASYSNYPTITNKTFIKLYVDAHNKFRSGVNPPASNMIYMTFDLGLAKIANAWGKKCISDHNPEDMDHPDPKFRPCGENLWFGGASKKPFDPTGAVGAFSSEVKYYDYSNHKCTRVCGHYTQVVWASSYKVGCAVVVCPKLGGKKNIAILVCNYGPPGNYQGVRPYKTGTPCSECPKGDTCQNNQCRNPEREKENSHRYSGWYPPFETWTTCDAACIAAVVLRLLLMLLAFVAVYFLKIRYPGLNSQK